VNTFEVWVSNDKVTYTKVFSGQSSGTTSGFERYNVKDSSARYLMIKVTRNSENNYASISEVVINRATSTTGSSIDKFGIKKIYPTKSGGEEWFMDMTDGQDPRSKPPSMTKNSDGSWKVTSTKVRYGVYTSSGYDPDKITTLDHSEIAQKGYMQSPNDWKNFEMTGYAKVNSGQSGENLLGMVEEEDIRETDIRRDVKVQHIKETYTTMEERDLRKNNGMSLMSLHLISNQWAQ